MRAPRSNAFVIGLCIGTAFNLLMQLVLAWERTQ